MTLDARLVHDWIFAAERDDLPELKRLFAKDQRLVDAQGQGPYWVGNFRALHYAVSRQHKRVARWLLARGASPRPIPGDGDWAPIHFAVIPKSPDMVRLLVKHGAQKDVFVAAMLGEAGVVQRMLRANPALLTSRGPDGATPLHFAGSPAVAKVLLTAGGDPFSRDRFHKETAFEWTSARPDVLAVLAKAAGVSAGIHLASALGDLRRVKALVRGDRRAINGKAGKRRTLGAEGETPLGLASRFGHEDVVAFLLEQGARAATRPSLLPAAVQAGNRAIVKRLLDAGADPNAFGPHGYAAIHAATISGNLAMIRLLLSSGARLDLKDKVHKSIALGWAVFHKHPRAAELLRRRGARLPFSYPA